MESFWNVTDVSTDQEDFYLQPDFIYRVFRLVGHYNPDNIKYLSAARFRDADGDHENDVDSIAVEGSVEYLLDDWLEDQSDSNDINTVYTFNHGKTGIFWEDNSFLNIDSDRDGNCHDWDIGMPAERIWDEEVDDWLPEYGSGPLENGRLNFITEACYIGHFIDECADDSRIITASTTIDKNASPMTGMDFPSFSFNLFKKMADGETSLGDAFNVVCPFVEEEDYLPHIMDQNPKLDDWGDSNHLGSDHILPNGNDGIWALKTGL